MPTVEEIFDDANGELALGELEKAAALYQKTVEIDATFFEGWHALGMAFLKLEKYPEAIEAMKKSIELKPNDQMAYTSLSIAYARNHQIKEAEDMGAKARILSWGGKVVK
jgi:tetratricopeptide (TPR) repeat protein